MRLCAAMDIQFQPERPRSRYHRGWGNECIKPKPVLCSWSVSFKDIHNQPIELTFDLFDDESPLTIGLDIRRYSVTDMTSKPATMTIKRPEDSKPRTVEVYVTSSRYNSRAHMRITYMMKSLLSANSQHIRPTTLAKRLHRLTHAPPEELIQLCRRPGHISKSVEEEIRAISDNCLICAKSGPPKPMRKISINHVNQAFNVEIQIDFTFVGIRGTQYNCLHMVDCGTGYSEAGIVSDRKSNTTVRLIETEWINRHGAPEALSADDEMTSKEIRRFLNGRNIELKGRPVRRHNKTGIIERKNGVVKRILEKIQKEDSTDTDKTIFSRAVFLSNLFTGSKVLSSFELAKGYAPSILGAPRRMVSEELMQAYMEQCETRALQKVMRSRNPSTLSQLHINPGDEILFYFKTSAHNVPDEWREATVVRAHPHYVEVRRKEKGPISKVAYEDIRLRPSSALTRELSEGLMED